MFVAMVKGNRTPLMELRSKRNKKKVSGEALCATVPKLLTNIFVMLKRHLDYWYLEGRLYQRKLQMHERAHHTLTFIGIH